MTQINQNQKRTVVILAKLLKRTGYIAKTIEIEIKTPSIGGLATNVALNAVENEIPNKNILVKKNRL